MNSSRFRSVYYEVNAESNVIPWVDLVEAGTSRGRTTFSRLVRGPRSTEEVGVARP
jgi:hypothetical protein